MKTYDEQVKDFFYWITEFDHIIPVGFEKNIIHFFNFLNKKENKSAPINIEYFYKLKDNINFIPGSLHLQNRVIDFFPNDLIIGGDLILSNVVLNNNPVNITVIGNLYLTHATTRKLDPLPLNVKVYGNVFLLGSYLTRNFSKSEIKCMFPNSKKIFDRIEYTD
jgi:hypothetical protein